MTTERRRHLIREMSRMERNDIEELRTSLALRRERGDEVGFELNLVIAVIAFLWTH